MPQVYKRGELNLYASMRSRQVFACPGGGGVRAWDGELHIDWVEGEEHTSAAAV